MSVPRPIWFHIFNDLEEETDVEFMEDIKSGGV